MTLSSVVLNNVRSSPSRGRHREGKQSLVVRRAETCRRIPSSNSVETCSRDNTTASADLATLDIGESGARRVIQPRIEESKTLLSRSNPSAVEQLEDACSRWCGAGCARHGLRRPGGDDDEIGSLGGDIRISATRRVEVVCHGAVGGINCEPLVDNRVLVVWSSEDLGEATTARRLSILRRVACSSTNSSDPWATGRKSGFEGCLSVHLAGGTHTRVTGRDEDGNTTSSEL